MSEKLMDEVQLEDYILRIFWGRPPEYVEHTRDICTVVILLKVNMKEIFKEQIHISEKAEITAINTIKYLYPDILKPPIDENNITGNLMIKYAIVKAKDRIESDNFEEGEIYKEEIMSDSVESWVHEAIKLL